MSAKRVRDEYFRMRRESITPEDRSRADRATHLKRHYHISLSEYEALELKQNGVCAICQRPESSRAANGKIRNLCLDHDHACCSTPRGCCGRCIRGLLCRACNTALGLLNDDPEVIKRALLYIEMSRQNVI